MLTFVGLQGYTELLDLLAEVSPQRDPGLNFTSMATGVEAFPQIIACTYSNRQLRSCLKNLLQSLTKSLWPPAKVSSLLRSSSGMISSFAESLSKAARMEADCE